MQFFSKKKSDPIAERTKVLQAEIKALESRIGRLSSEVEKKAEAANSPENSKPPPETIFESLTGPAPESDSSPEHFNDLGVRKYDLLSAWNRLKSQFRGPPPSNPKLVSYLAAGAIRGLRPLRYEKRVARNRFILLVVVLFVLLWGLTVALFRAL